MSRDKTDRERISELESLVHNLETEIEFQCNMRTITERKLEKARERINALESELAECEENLADWEST